MSLGCYSQRSINFSTTMLINFTPHLKIMKTLLIRLQTFFKSKIERIRSQITDQHQGTFSPTTSVYVESRHCSTRLSSFESPDDISIFDLIKKSTIKSCSLDPLPATIMRKRYIKTSSYLKNIVNLSLTSGKMPNELKSAMIRLLLKKPNADTETFSSFLPVLNLRFVSKVIEEGAFVQLNDRLMRNGLHEPLQSAYKALQSTETALIRVPNDIVPSVDSGQNVIWCSWICRRLSTLLITRFLSQDCTSISALVTPPWIGLEITYTIARNLSTSSIRSQTNVIY